MPQVIPQMKRCQVAAKNIPSRMIGGDFYDFIAFGQTHLGMVIADVSGKGIPGAILMASARATLRAYLERPAYSQRINNKAQPRPLQGYSGESICYTFLWRC